MAKRAIRSLVVIRKISGELKIEDGAKTHGVSMSIIEYL
jgi:hypothetical protein